MAAIILAFILGYLYARNQIKINTYVKNTFNDLKYKDKDKE